MAGTVRQRLDRVRALPFGEDVRQVEISFATNLRIYLAAVAVLTAMAGVDLIDLPHWLTAVATVCAIGAAFWFRAVCKLAYARQFYERGDQGDHGSTKEGA